MPTVQKGNGGGGAFLTQKGEKIGEVKKEIAELEQLLATTSQTSQSTQLLKKRKEMKEVDNALELMKNDYKRRMDECEERRLSFENKQAKMRDQVLKFERFIQENDAKRLRAEAKAKAERKMYMEKMDEIAQKKDELLKLERAQEELKAELERRRCFRDFLENVVESSDKSSDMTYEEVPDVLNRYDVLTTANDDLVQVESTQDVEVDECVTRIQRDRDIAIVIDVIDVIDVIGVIGVVYLVPIFGTPAASHPTHSSSLPTKHYRYRKNLQMLRTEAQNIELTRNSSLHGKQKSLERIRQAGKEWEHEQGLLMDKEKSVQQEWGAVEGAIRNIYSRCCATMRNQPLFPPPATASLMEVLEFDLDVMWTRIVDLISIRQDYRPSDSTVLGDLAELSVSTMATGVGGGASITNVNQGGGSQVI